MKTRSVIFAAAMHAASAAHAAPSAVTISDAWIRALPGSTPSGGYFTLKNAGDTAVSLTGATSPACGMLMLHKSDMMGGMAHMDMVDSVDVPAHGSLSFTPGGYHLMCMDPPAPLKPGTSVPVTLQFKGGASLTAPFAVRNAAGH